MNYLTRPVFELLANWRSLPAASFQYDLNDAQIGFGVRRATPTQSQVVRGWKFDLTSKTLAEVEEFTSFFDAVKGRTIGFWFPEPVKIADIENGVSATVFDVVAQGWADSWDENAEQHLYFFKDGVAAQCAKVTGVALSGGKDRVTVNANVTVDETWLVFRLLYCRFSTDQDSFELRGEGHEHRQVKVVELPKEYSAIESGEQKIYFYHFSLATTTPKHWRYTSFDQDVLSNGNAFLSAGITHGNIRFSAKGGREATTIDAHYVPGHPLSLFVPVPLSKPLAVEILEASFLNPDATTVLFNGFVLKAPFTGMIQKAQCSSDMDYLGQRILSMVIHNRCNYAVFELATCKLVAAVFQVNCTITAISGNILELSGVGLDGKAGDWFASGWLEIGDGETFEIRSILKSTPEVGNKIHVVLDLPLQFAALTNTVKIFPGCDGTSETCKVKFNNFLNYGGHRTPKDNPAIKGFEIEDESTGKK